MNKAERVIHQFVQFLSTGSKKEASAFLTALELCGEESLAERCRAVFVMYYN